MGGLQVHERAPVVDHGAKSRLRVGVGVVNEADDVHREPDCAAKMGKDVGSPAPGFNFAPNLVKSPSGVDGAMRTFPLLLSIVLLLAGCVGAAVEDEPETPMDKAPEVAETPEEPRATDDETPDEPAQPAPGNEERPESTGETEVEPAQAVQEAQPWTLDAPFRLGWAQAVGGPEGREVHGTTSAEYCPDAWFTPPAGTSALRLTATGEAAHATPGGGFLVVDVTLPDGSLETFGPFWPEHEAFAKHYATSEPQPGAWSLHVRAIGPVVDQALDIMLTLEGASVEIPLLSVGAPACE